MSGVPIRWKLTAWYGLVITLVISVCSFGVYELFGSHLLTRTDFELDEELDELELEVKLASSEAEAVEHLQQRFFRHASFEFQVSRGSSLLFRSEGLLKQPLSLVNPLPAGSEDSSFDNEESSSHIDRRVASRLTKGPEGDYLVQAIMSLDANEEQLAELRRSLWAIGPLTVIASIAGGYLLAWKALKPVDDMARAAHEVTASRLETRLPISNPTDELGHLAQAFNSMLERIQGAVSELKRFTADAAHELRTPLAVMRTETEVALRSSQSVSDYRNALEVNLEAISRLTRLAEQLLMLARSDGNAGRLRVDEVPFDALVLDVVERVKDMASAKSIDLRVAPMEELTVNGDDTQLSQVVFNLLENAIKYTPTAGWVEVAASRQNGHVSFTVRDNGHGVPDADLPHVFKRFYRVDKSRNGQSGGIGLGLSICQTIIEAHGGRIELRNADAAGAVVSVTLPAAYPS
jgi:heavy metal sensor kinase